MSAPHTSAVVPDGVQLAMPGNWWQLPLDPKTRHQGIAALVDARLAVEPRMQPLRNELIAALRRTARDAADKGAVLCGSMAMTAEDAALSANVLVLIDPVVLNEGDEQPTADLSAFQRTITETMVGTEVRNAQVGVVELPFAGPAIRLAGRRTVSVDIVGRDVEVVSVQYFVPVPGTLLTAIVTFTSPSLVYEPALVEMFDAMAATLTFSSPPEAQAAGDDVPEADA